MWDALPSDVVRVILHWVHRANQPHRDAQRVQRAWRGYRVRVLVGRFRMLRYLREFRAWNPSLGEFLRRARL